MHKFIVALLLIAAPTVAAAADAHKAALRVTDQFVIPKYETLARAAAAQEEAWRSFCSGRVEPESKSVAVAYHRVADAWAEAQIVKTGPIALFLRQERFYYWPEAHDATARALRTLIASNDPKALEPVTLAHDSVAGQGLPALERLLFDANVIAEAKATHRGKRCAVGHAIARNLNVIAGDTLKEWKEPNGVRAAIAANKSWRGMISDSNEAARLLLTDLVGVLQLIDDTKLLNVLGKDAASARPKLAEAWRSGRAARDIQLNLVAARDMTDLFARDLNKADRAKLDGVLNEAIRAAKGLPADLGKAAADPKRRAKLEAARVAVKAALATVSRVLPAGLGLNLGFNALDGD